MRQKFIYSFLLLVGLFIGIVACNNSEPKLTLDKNEVTIVQFEKTTITATLLNSNDEIEWTVSNDDIVQLTVSEDGRVAEIVGLIDGNSTIIAKAGKVEANVDVTVNKSSAQPTLKINEENVTLQNGQQQTLTVNASLGENPITVSVTWSSKNTDIVSVTDGVIKGLRAGSTEVTAEAEYYGVNLSDTITVKVLATVEFTVDESDIVLYTYSDIPEHKTTYTIEPILLIDGEVGDINLIVWESDDEEVVTVTDGVIKTEGRGRATVTGTFITEDNQVLTQFIFVDVISPIIETDVKFDLVYKDSTIINLTELDIKANDVTDVFDITNGTQKRLLFTVSDEYSIELRQEDIVAGDREIVIYNNEFGKTMDIAMITMIITNADELDAMTRTAIEFYGTENPENANGVTYYPKAGGYYVLGSDIDYSGRVFAPIGDWGPSERWLSVFDGIFDGRGYTIYEFKVDRANGAMFPCMDTSAIVRNVTFSNAFVGWASGLISVESNGLIENIFINGELNSGMPWCMNSLVISRFGSTSGRIKNVVVIVDKVIGQNNGAVVGNVTDSIPSQLENVLVIGTLKEAATREGILVDLETVFSFETIDQYVNSNFDLSNFDKSIWWIKDGYIPLLHNYASDINKGIELINEDRIAYIGQKIKLIHADDFPVKYEVNSNVEGIEIDDNGYITVSLSVDDGTEFDIIIYSVLTDEIIIEKFVAKNVPVIDLTSKGVLGTLESGRQENQIIEIVEIDDKLSHFMLDIHKIMVIPDNETNGKFTVSSESLKDLPYGENVEVYLVSENGNRYKVLFNVYTLIIHNLDDYELFVNLAKNYYADGNPLYTNEGHPYYRKSGGFYILANDLDFNNGPFKDYIIGGWSDSAMGFLGEFAGIFDGKGHALKNISYLGEGETGGNVGLFASIHRDGIVRNLAFHDVAMMWNGWGAPIASQCDGLIENVYVRGFVQTGGISWCHSSLLIRNLEENGVLRNIVVHATSPFPEGGLGASVIAQAMTLGKEISNVILIGDVREAAIWGENNQSSHYVDLDGIDAYATIEDFKSANIDNIISNKFTSEYWDISGDYPVIIPR